MSDGTRLQCDLASQLARLAGRKSAAELGESLTHRSGLGRERQAQRILRGQRWPTADDLAAILDELGAEIIVQPQRELFAKKTAKKKTAKKKTAKKKTAKKKTAKKKTAKKKGKS